jgi:hypothetical protein
VAADTSDGAREGDDSAGIDGVEPGEHTLLARR